MEGEKGEEGEEGFRFTPASPFLPSCRLADFSTCGSIGKQVLVTLSQPPVHHSAVLMHGTPSPEQAAWRQVD